MRSSVTTQSLVYTPEGTTDSVTGGGTTPFFYGTSSIARAPISLTPNAGVTGGTGVAGLPSWDSMTQDLYGLETSLQQQSLARAESKVVLTGAEKVLNGVVTTAGGVTAEGIADNDPATLPTANSAPSSLMQSTVTSNISGGGNALDVKAASVNPVQCPPGQIAPVWMTGLEQGPGLNPVNDTNHPFYGLFNAAAVGVSSSVAKTGAYSLTAFPSGGAGYIYQLLPSQTTPRMIEKFAFRLGSLPSLDVTEMATGSTTTAGSYFRMGFDAGPNKLYMQLGLTGTKYLASSSVVAGQWYTIDIKYDTSTTTHRLDWRIDGVDQPQATMSAAVTNAQAFIFGTQTLADVYTAYYDDLVISQTAADYPIGDGKVLSLKPDAVGTHVNPTRFLDNDGTAIDPTSWTRLDEIPMNSTADYVAQITAGSTSYLEMTFANTTETCIRGVSALVGWTPTSSSANNGKTSIFNGATETIVHSGLMAATAGPVRHNRRIIPPVTSPWTQAQLNGLKVRVGYSTDVSPIPRWDSLLLEYYVPVLPAEGGPGTRDRLDGVHHRRERGDSLRQPHPDRRTGLQLRQRGLLDGRTPPSESDGRSLGFRRRDGKALQVHAHHAGGLDLIRMGPARSRERGAGTVEEVVVRYPGMHELGALPTSVGAGPAGWPGYWVKYDAGTSASSVSAEAGIGSEPPSFTSSGTISYWNGTGVSTMAPPSAGGSIPVTPVDYTSGGFRVEISGSLSTAPSFVSQVPAGAAGTADRFESRATLGSPVSGTFTYKVTNTSTSAVICNLTVAIDLGALLATARYAP